MSLGKNQLGRENYLNHTNPNLKISFDGLITNPPYADSSHGESKNTLWRKWFKFDALLNQEAIFAEVIPASWMGSAELIGNYLLDNKSHLNRNITHINLEECNRHFKGVGQKFSYVIYTKESYSNKTELVFKNINNEIENFTGNLNNAIFFNVFPRDLTPHAISILNKVIINTDPLGILNSTVCHANNKHLWKHSPEGDFVFPIEKTPHTTIYYKKAHPDQGTPKIVIPTTTYFRKMYYTTHGTSQSFCYYNLDDLVNETVVLNNLNNKLFDYVNECFRYSNWNSVNLLKKLPNIPMDIMMTDDEIFEYFKLTDQEINHINNVVSWR